MKVLICDYTGNSAQWIDEFIIKKNLEVVGTITSATDEKLVAKNSWEYILVFEDGMQKFFLSTIAQPAKISESRIVFALDWNNWAIHPAVAQVLLNQTGGGIIQRLFHFNIARHLNSYIVASTKDDFHFINSSEKAGGLLSNIYYTKRNFSADELDLLHQLAKEFYNVDDSAGYFLDIGAHIGTSGIYFVKKFTPNLKLLAFEPDSENIKFLRINLILNDMEKNTSIEPCAVGATDSEQILYKAGSGAHSFFNYRNDVVESESMKIVSLDNFLEKKRITPEDIKYIWIDTEGFEAQVVIGAKNLLAKNPAPLYMEFSPTFWNKSGYYDKMMEVLMKYYSKFIFIGETLKKGTKTLQPIENLWEFKNSTINRMGAASEELVRENIFLVKK